MINKYFFTLAAIVLLAGGCASSMTSDIRVETDADPKANLAGYRSYAWLGSAAIVFDDKGRWEPPQFDADAEIKFLIDRELRARGMTEKSVNPDLVVAYAAGIDMDSMDIATDPESGLDVVKESPAGALTVVLVDAETGMAVWVGVATADIHQNPDPENSRKRLDYAVSKMFDKLPR